MKRFKKSLFVMILFGLFFPSLYPISISSQTALHKKITMIGLDGNPITIDSKIPYSPKRTCGACHDYNRITNGYHFQLLDGYYSPFSLENINHGALGNKSGMSEADCLICHMKGYQWKERGAVLRGGFLKYGPTVGAGWANVKLYQDYFGKLKADEVNIDYSKKDPADFEYLHLQIIKRPPDENCWSCHNTSDGWKRGSEWNPETDIHKAKGLNCVTCHPSDREHNFAKGDSLQGTVRNDLDNTMYSCEDCHYKSRAKGAPRYSHPFSPRHMRMIACQTCHIPFQPTSADLVYDNASTGSTMIYDTSKFLSNNPTDPNQSMSETNLNLWYPTLREFKGKIVPVKSLTIIYWGELDEKTNVVKPILLWKIQSLNKPVLKDDNGDGIPEINSIDEIKTFLKTLKEKDKSGNSVANNPVLVKGGFLYHLSKNGNVEKIEHDQTGTLDFSLNHNVLSGASVIGARGCKDCHSKNSLFFLRKILLDPYNEEGKPIYIENWRRLGINREELNRLLLEQ